MHLLPVVLGRRRPALAEGMCFCRSCSNASMRTLVRSLQTSQGHSPSSTKLRSIQLFGNAPEQACQAVMRKTRMWKSRSPHARVSKSPLHLILAHCVVHLRAASHGRSAVCTSERNCAAIDLWIDQKWLSKSANSTSSRAMKQPL